MLTTLHWKEVVVLLAEKINEEKYIPCVGGGVDYDIGFQTRNTSGSTRSKMNGGQVQLVMAFQVVILWCVLVVVVLKQDRYVAVEVQREDDGEEGRKEET